MARSLYSTVEIEIGVVFCEIFSRVHLQFGLELRDKEAAELMVLGAADSSCEGRSNGSGLMKFRRAMELQNQNLILHSWVHGDGLET